MGTRIYVYRNEGLGLVYDDFAARGERNAALESLGYLALYIVALEYRYVFFKKLDFAPGATRYFGDGT